MDFLAFKAALKNAQSRKWTPRQRHLDALERALYGEIYDHIDSPFSQEYESNNEFGKRLPLDKRRAAAAYPLAKIITHDVTGMLFGEEHRPTIVVRDADYTSIWLQAFIEDSSFWLTMMEAAWSGSIGSVVPVLRVLGDMQEVVDETDGTKSRKPNGPGQFFWEVWPSKECAPVFHRHRPGELKSIVRTYPVSADALRADGYDLEAISKAWAKKPAGRGLGKAIPDEWMLRIELDDIVETWCLPVPKTIYERDDFKDKDWEIDADRTFPHKLGEVPARWIIPMRDRHKKFPDGMCYFEPAIDFQFRIDRSISQTGRAFDYAGDPQLAVASGGSGKQEFGEIEDDTPVGATSSDVVDVAEKGGAWFLEIKGDGLQVAIDTYVRTLIRLGKESVAASRIEHESKTGTALSGTAMKLLNASLIYLVGILRITFGELGIVPLLRLAMRMNEKVDVELPSLAARLSEAKISKGEPDQNALIELQWGPYYEPTGQDKLFEVQATTAAIEGGIISQETGVSNAAQLFDVQDSAQELGRIKTETAERQKQDLAVQQQAAALKQSPDGA